MDGISSEAWFYRGKNLKRCLRHILVSVCEGNELPETKKKRNGRSKDYMGFGRKKI